MKPRIVFAGLFHETHTFLDQDTSWDDFEVPVDQAVLGKIGDSSPTDGFLEEAGRQGWEVIPTIDARATPSGIVQDEMFKRYRTEFERRARPALAQGADAIYLVLHGAMVTRSLVDPEGELLARVRALPGAEKLPMFGVLDLHANVSARMCALAVGGRGSSLDAGPVEIEGVVVSRSDGNFTLEDKQSHLASMSGVHIAMGPCAVIRASGVTILLTSRKTPPFDLGQLRSQGIEPRDFAIIGVKAAVAHRRAYDPITAATYYVDTPDPCTSNLESLPWQHLARPIYPLDPIATPEFKFS